MTLALSEGQQLHAETIAWRARQLASNCARTGHLLVGLQGLFLVCWQPVCSIYQTTKVSVHFVLANVISMHSNLKLAHSDVIILSVPLHFNVLELIVRIKRCIRCVKLL